MAELRATDKLRRPPIRTVKTVVVKLGGARLLEDALLARVSALVRHHWENGERVVLVHGHGQGDLVRAPDRDTAQTLVTRGLLNTTLVGRLVRDGLLAVGLSAVDLGLVDYGSPTHGWVDGQRVRRLLEEGLIPVLAPVALGADGRPVSCGEDELAQAVAKAIGADTLTLLGDEPGPAKHIEEARARDLLAREDLAPDLRLRLETALGALKQGVRDVRLAGLEARG